MPPQIRILGTTKNTENMTTINMPNYKQKDKDLYQENDTRNMTKQQKKKNLAQETSKEPLHPIQSTGLQLVNDED